MSASGQLTPLQSGPITVEASIDGEVWEVTVDAYDWVRLVGSGTVFHTVAADLPVTNSFGSTEYPDLVFSCESRGQFFAWVSFDRIITASGNVAISLNGNTPISEVWSEINSFDALFKPGSEATKKAFAQRVASARRFGFAFGEFQAGSKATLFRVTGLAPRLTELVSLCPSGSVVQPGTAQSAASAFAEAQDVIAAFDASAGRVDALREARRQQGASVTSAPSAVFQHTLPACSPGG